MATLTIPLSEEEMTRLNELAREADSTPDELVRTLHKAAIEAMSTAKARQEIAKVDAAVVTIETPEKLAAEIKAEMATWERLVPQVMSLPKDN